MDFLYSVNGAKREPPLPDERSTSQFGLGSATAQMLRLRRKGQTGLGDAPAGGRPDRDRGTAAPLFRRSGDDIHVELPIPLKQGVLGRKMEVADANR
jgi:DnaJ-class molecular chaperone